MKILFCDFNGTIVGDMKFWEKAMRATFSAFGKEPPTAAQYFMELESGDYIEPYRRRDITASRDELNAIYEPVYDELVSQLNETNVFPGVIETLKKLREKGTTLVLLTASKETQVKPLIKKCGLEGIFQWKIFHCLDKARSIKSVIETENISRNEDEEIKPSDCYFIGDAPSDIRHAKKAGVRSVAFYTKYIPAELLMKQQPQFFIAKFEYLLFFD